MSWQWRPTQVVICISQLHLYLISVWAHTQKTRPNEPVCVKLVSRGKLKTRFAFDDIQNSFTCCCQRQKHMLTFYVFLPPWGELQLLQSCTTQTRCHHGQLKLGWGKSSQAGPWFGQPLFQYCMEVFGSLTWNKIKWIEMFCMYFIYIHTSKLCP